MEQLSEGIDFAAVVIHAQTIATNQEGVCSTEVETDLMSLSAEVARRLARHEGIARMELLQLTTWRLGKGVPPST